MQKFRKAYHTGMRRVHIVGLSPRSGTTLLQELMAHCFEFDGVPNHEMSIFGIPDGNPQTICTKAPRELGVTLDIGPMPGFWCICMIRDPRDIVVSKHQVRPDHFYTDFSLFNCNYRLLDTRRKWHPNIITIKYERLVADPDGVQAYLQRQIPFLQKKAAFSDFPKIANPSPDSIAALGGVREINTARIGNWKNHLPRIKAQLETYDSMSEIVRQLGYEEDDSWIELLDRVVADNGLQPDRPRHSLYSRLHEKIQTARKILLARRRISRACRDRLH